jgi:hypothetical protein
VSQTADPWLDESPGPHGKQREDGRAPTGRNEPAGHGMHGRPNSTVASGEYSVPAAQLSHNPDAVLQHGHSQRVSILGREWRT